MSYGVEDDRVLCIFASTLEGAPPQNGSINISRKFQSRSGENGREVHDRGYTTYLHIRKYVRKFRRVLRFRYVKKITSFRETGGDPIYSNGAGKLWIEFPHKPVQFIEDRNRDLPNFGSPKPKQVVGFTKKRRIPIYSWVKIPYTVKEPYQVLKTKLKKIHVPPSTYPDQTPHQFNFVRAERSGLDSSVEVTYVYKYPPPPGSDPYPVGKTVIVGKIAGLHAGGDLGYTPFGTNEDFLIETSADLEPLRTQSLYKMASAARDGIANFSNIVAEREGLKRTIQQWAIGSLSTLLKGKKAIAKALLENSTDHRKIAQGYLSFIYGLKPALQDFSNAIRELSEQGRTWRKYKGTARRKWEKSYSFQNGPSKITISRTFDLIVKNQVMVTGTDDHPVISNHSSINWLEAGWEITPWSFVADWFIPIGNFLASQDLFSGVTVKSWHETVVYREQYTIIVEHSGSYGDYIYSGGTQVFQGKYLNVYRTIRSGTPVLPFPQFKSPLSRIHGLNALFLLISLLKR